MILAAVRDVGVHIPVAAQKKKKRNRELCSYRRAETYAGCVPH